MKLTYTLTITKGVLNSHPSHNLNSPEINKKVSDLRTQLEGLSGFDNTSQIVYYLRFLGDKGLHIAVVKARDKGEGRPKDNKAIWINIPAKLRLMEPKEEREQGVSQISTAVQLATTALKNSSLEIKELDELFEPIEFGKNDTVEESILSTIKPVKADKHSRQAAVYFGDDTDYTFDSLFNKYLVQEAYKKYEGVFFIEKNTGIKVNSQKVDEIEELYPYLNVPHPEDYGYNIYYHYHDKEVPFKNPIQRSGQSSLKITYKKENRVTIEKDIELKKDNWQKELLLKDDERKIVVQRDFFKVINANSDRIQDVEIRVHTRDAQYKIKESLEIKEKEVENELKITFEAEGYDSKEYTLAIKELETKIKKESIEIILQDKLYTAIIEIPIDKSKNHSHTEKFNNTITVPYYREIDKDLIEGYKLEENKAKSSSNTNSSETHYILKSTKKKDYLKLLALGFVTGAIVAVVCWSLFGSNNLRSEEKTINNQQENGSNSTPNQEDNSSDINQSLRYGEKTNGTDSISPKKKSNNNQQK